MATHYSDSEARRTQRNLIFGTNMVETKSPPINYCIYCDVSGQDTSLTDEHVVPYALNGDIVLQSASCEACAKITSGIELFALRRMYHEVRIHLKTQTRRP